MTTRGHPPDTSILKDNVELKAQLELLTSKYGKLEEIHEKLSSSNEDLLSSHTKLRLALEAITTKVTSGETMWTMAQLYLKMQIGRAHV